MEGGEGLLDEILSLGGEERCVIEVKIRSDLVHDLFTSCGENQRDGDGECADGERHQGEESELRRIEDDDAHPTQKSERSGRGATEQTCPYTARGRLRVDLNRLVI